MDNQEMKTNAPAAEGPAEEKPAAQEPVTVEPAAQQPVTQEPVTQEPVTQEPAAQQTSAQEPAPAVKQKTRFWPGFFTGILAGSVLGCFLCAGAIITIFRNRAHGSGAAGTSGQVTVEVGEVKPNPKSLDYDRIKSKIRLLQTIISRNYLFDENPEDVENGIYSGMMEGLGDPYSVYYTEKEYAELTEQTDGTYSGIGALLSKDPATGICTVIKVFAGSPAEEAGLRAGDILYSADGHKVQEEDLDYFVSTYVRGIDGTDVELVVLRGEQLEEVTMKVTRRVIDVPTVEYQMLEGKTGYIAVSQFDIITPEQFKEAVNALNGQGMQSLVIDLRSNPGGVVQSAVEMLDYMLPDGLLVYTAGRSGVGDKYYSEDGHEVDLPTVILINGNSASASEIFAGAYKDFGRAKLVGTTTFGKGIVQFVLPLGDGSAVKLTSQHYYTPNGFDLHGKGIEPDVTVEPGEDDVAVEKDAQLEKALEVLKNN